MACAVYVDAIANDKFQPDPDNPGFNLLGGMKDAGHMQRLGRETGAPLPCAFSVSAQPHIAEIRTLLSKARQQHRMRCALIR